MTSVIPLHDDDDFSPTAGKSWKTLSVDAYFIEKSFILWVYAKTLAVSSAKRMRIQFSTSLPSAVL